MLDTFCASLSDDAQLRIVVRLGKLALPIWENYFKQNPTAIDQVNALITDDNRIEGGLKVIDVEFPKRCLEKIERSYQSAKEKSADRPLPVMKGDPTLSPMLATCMQPLTSKQWDKVLDESVRLVFTSIFNMLIWIQFKRNTPYHETHIYVAINQAADALLREKMMEQQPLNDLLAEYNKETRQPSEESDWENAFRVGRSEPQSEDDIFRRMLGEKIYQGKCGLAVAKEALRQMREEGKTYWDDSDYSYSKTYSWDKEKQSFNRYLWDEIIGGGADIEMTESEMLEFIAQLTLADLREARFEV